MSNKSEATWHPNSGPATDHADLIAEARALRTDSPRGDLISVARQLTDALVVLSNSIPHDVDCEAVHFAGSVAPPWTPCGCDERRVATAQRERDGARAERDALAHVIARVRRWEQEYADHGADMHDLRVELNAAPSVSLARHDELLKAEVYQSIADHPGYDSNTRKAASNIAAAFREEAE